MPPYSDADIIALLTRHDCTLPFHIVRTRLMGAITSPQVLLSPIKTFQELWGGQWPVFKNEKEVAVLMNELSSFWNRLTAHQERGNPFRLLHVDVEASRESLRQFAKIRDEELDGFYDGLCSGSDEFEMSPDCISALDTLAEMHGFFADIFLLLENTDALQNTTQAEYHDLRKKLHSVTRIANDSIQKIIHLNTAERRLAISSMSNRPGTLH